MNDILPKSRKPNSLEVSIPYTVLERHLESIATANCGILCINRILDECSDSDLPNELEFINGEFSKGGLMGAIEMLSDAIANSETALFRIMIESKEEQL